MATREIITGVRELKVNLTDFENKAAVFIDKDGEWVGEPIYYRAGFDKAVRSVVRELHLTVMNKTLWIIDWIG